jgi:hypothetical protein
MSTEREFLDERYAYTESSPNGKELVCNCIEQVASGAVLQERDITFIGEIGYGVTTYDIPANLVRSRDPHELVNRIAAALPVATPHNTKVSLLKHSDNTGKDDCAYVLLIWGNGSTESGRVARVMDIDTARIASIQKAEDSYGKTKVMTCHQMSAIQPPLIHHSEAYRKRIGASVILSLCGEVDPIAPSNDTCVRQICHKQGDPHMYLLHDYYARGTENMWLMHGPSEGATLYTLEEHVEVCSCISNQGVPVIDQKNKGCEKESKSATDFERNAIAIAGQPYASYAANNCLQSVESSDGGVTRFIPVNSLDSNFSKVRPLDIAQGLAGYTSDKYVSVCTVVGSSLSSNGLLYGNIPIDPLSCIHHTNTHHNGQIVIPNTSEWMQTLFEISPDKSTLYFLGHAGTKTLRDKAGTVSAYRIPRCLLTGLDTK